MTVTASAVRRRPVRSTGSRRRVRSRLAVVASLTLCTGLAILAGGAPPAGAASGTFSNTGAITIPLGAPGTTSGNASPYPSVITVSGLYGLITDVNVKLDNLGHTHADDLDVLLVSPSGDSTVLMSDACNGTDFEDFDYTFDDEAGGVMPDNPTGACTSFFYKPSSYDAGSDTWPGGSPGPHGTTMSRFDGENPLGTWYLYVSDDTAGDVGDVELGWSLTITTGPYDVAIPSSGNASPYPRTVTVSSDELVTDVDVAVSGLTHSHPDDIDMLMVGPSGNSTVLMSDACGSYNVTNYFWRWDDEAATTMADSGTSNVCSGFSYRPTNHGSGDSWPAPAPSGGSSSLSVHDLGPAGGVWSFYIVDDVGGDGGFLINPPMIELTTRPRAVTKLPSAALTLAEGFSGNIAITRSAPGATASGSVTVTGGGGNAEVEDYATISQVVSFAPGELTKSVPIVIANDATEEGPETFTIALTAPSGDISLGSPSRTKVTIRTSDAVAPETEVTKKPPKETTKRSAKIKFRSSEPGTFQCKVDNGRWKACRSALKVKNLSFGKHKVQIRAVDRAGITDGTPAKVTWKVLRP